MREQFRRKFKDFVVIPVSEIHKAFPDFNAKNLINWQKQGYLIKVRNRFYMSSEVEVDEQVLFHIANKIYDPSYVSMESALNVYGIIPEGVYSVQSVSTRKTNAFNTKVASFNYQTIKKDLYFGYRLIQRDTFTYRMASLEKAVLDFLYLRPDICDEQSIEGLRWNKDALALLDEPKLQQYLKVYNSPTLRQKVKALNRYRDAQH